MFPNFADKQDKEPIFTPGEFVGYLRASGRYPKFSTPSGIIFSYQKTLLDYVIKNHRVAKVETVMGEMYLLKETNNQIAIVGKLGIGAPAVITALEELNAWGVKKYISIGTAGTLQKSLAIGDIVVCDKAIRDEGVSHHYLSSEKYAFASSVMVEKIKKSLEKLGQKYQVGSSWTIDAPYRETIAEAKEYQKEGVLTVEMEAAALFVVAGYRKVEMGAIFTVSDSLADFKWSPDFYHKETKEGLEILYKTALDVLLN
ncbi:purine phosphorylase [Candidatus Shapirobacteria bacterium CG03_land_8_20_14_0_80_40_19]|uniref:Uridine phosphorylase n=3 Tax=Candidatus Shapironibacteriota TaxID=1752721 RepID=A0A2M7BGM4_9BACT|nr:MAG: purine phosphorylase [Candidatus Shapirobacteria bacterium CG11_big_fil_rev_8_21_14_0_20_40_12]PIV02214.1 MAG: purine phosphorylase [Candidatus Shapirobacteria bacterium CG03_land_8_20_14_0_80_40_19]PJC76122.1 MAG: purine phosphorylase [Candidatus Shapirobacteria bacterium CG_4_8_14_3_um_filter_39_11]